MAFVDHRENSRVKWGRERDGITNPNSDDIRLGCMLRIADATEAMAKSHIQLQRELDTLKRRCDSLQADVDSLTRQRTALRGVVSRLRRKLKAGG